MKPGNTSQTSLKLFDVRGVHRFPCKKCFFGTQQDKFSFCSLEGKWSREADSAPLIRQLKVPL